MRHSEQMCGRYQRALDILSRRWTCLIITVLMEGPRRFCAIADRLEVIGDRMLSERLKELEAEGIVERRIYTDAPGRVEYALTEKGRALEVVTSAIHQWSREWIDLEANQVSGP